MQSAARLLRWNDSDGESAAVQIPAAARTFDGFIAWAASDGFPARGHVDYLDGEIHLDMSPEELETHNKVKGVITRVTSGLVESLDLGEYYYDRTLLANRKARLSTEPEAAFAKWETLESGRLKRIPRRDRWGEYIRIEGTVDWVLEVVSRSSWKKDTEILPKLYHRAAIGEYWLVDATSDEVDFAILNWKKGGYERGDSRNGWQYSAVFERWFKLTLTVVREEYRRYSLKVKR